MDDPHLRSKNHSSQSLLFPDPVIYCGRNVAQLSNNKAFKYCSTRKCPEVILTTSCIGNNENENKFKTLRVIFLNKKDQIQEIKGHVSQQRVPKLRNRSKTHPFNVGRLICLEVDSGAADEEKLPNSSKLCPVCHRSDLPNDMRNSFHIERISQMVEF